MLALQRISPLSVYGQKVTAVFPVIITVVSVSCLTILIIKTSPVNQANPWFRKSTFISLYDFIAVEFFKALDYNF